MAKLWMPGLNLPHPDQIPKCSHRPHPPLNVLQPTPLYTSISQPLTSVYTAACASPVSHRDALLDRVAVA
jgi:hypothetical protein